MRVFNIRYGFATNSSSSHSLIFIEPGSVQTDSDGCDYEDYGYGWEAFTLADRNAKARYFAAQMESSLSAGEYFKDRVIEDLDRNLIREVTGVEVDASVEYPPSVDHQSVWVMPRDWTGRRLHRSWIEQFRDFVLSDRIAVLGGNDNDGAHPLYRADRAWSERERGGIFDGEGLPRVVARFDERADYWTLFDRDSGTRTRVVFHEGDPPARASVPELVDLKITDHCPFGCSFCYQSSTRAGRHAPFESIEAVLKALASLQVFEVAIGGGEPTLHPDLDDILRCAVDLCIIPNLTTRNLKWLAEQDTASLARFGGIAYSVHSPGDVEKLITTMARIGAEGRAPFLRRERGQVNAQLVLGTVTREAYNEILRLCSSARITLTLLAYKPVGFGAQQAPLPYDWWLADWMGTRPSSCRLHVDTPLAAAYQARLTEANVPSWLYDVRDGAFSFYIDAVEWKCAPSSYEADLTLARPLSVGHDRLVESILYGFNRTRD